MNVCANLITAGGVGIDGGVDAEIEGAKEEGESVGSLGMIDGLYEVGKSDGDEVGEVGNNEKLAEVALFCRGVGWKETDGEESDGTTVRSSGLGVSAKELGDNGVGWDVVGTEVGRRDNVGSAVGVIVESAVGVNVGSAVDEATVGVNDKGCFVGLNVGFFDGIRLEGVLEEDIEGKLVGFRVFMVGILVGSAVGSLVGTTEGLEEEGDAVEGL